MREADPNFQKVRALIEARIRFELFEKQNGATDPKYIGQAGAITEAGVVLLSASLQTFVEEVFLECSEKLFGRQLEGIELKTYKESWKRWGNPSPKHIRRLFRRLGVIDVLSDLGDNRLITPEFLKTLDQLNQVRNDIAHGEKIKVDGTHFSLGLSKLQSWLKIVEDGAKNFRFNALHCCGLRGPDTNGEVKFVS